MNENTTKILILLFIILFLLFMATFFYIIYKRLNRKLPVIEPLPKMPNESSYKSLSSGKRNAIYNPQPQSLTGYNCHGYSQGTPVSYSGPCTGVDANNGWVTSFD